MGLALILPVYLISKKHGWGGDRWGTKAEIWQVFKEAFWGLFAPVIILGVFTEGFYSTEAAEPWLYFTDYWSDSLSIAM